MIAAYGETNGENAVGWKMRGIGNRNVKVLSEKQPVMARGTLRRNPPLSFIRKD
jgi:hypothetical protein